MLKTFFKPPIDCLPHFENKWTPIYLEHGKIFVDDYSIKWIDSTGMVCRMPSASLSSILIGPGTSITHEAIKICGESNVMICWVGEDAIKYYASGVSPTSTSKNAILQIEAYCDKKKRNKIARKMFEYRFPNEPSEEKTIKEMMGMEGRRVRETYNELKNEYKIEWRSRNYDVNDFSLCDAINSALNIANHGLYAYCLSCIHTMGFLPFCGFFHTGNNMSFVFDIADLFKTSTSIKCAFKICSEIENPKRESILTLLKSLVEEQEINEKMPKFLSGLFI